MITTSNSKKAFFGLALLLYCYVASSGQIIKLPGGKKPAGYDLQDTAQINTLLGLLVKQDSIPNAQMAVYIDKISAALAVNKHKKFLAKEYYKLSLVNAKTDHLPEATQDLDKAIALARETGNEKILGRSFIELGELHRYMDDYEQALLSYQEAAVHFDKINDEMGKADINNDIAIVYRELKDYDKALKYMELALKDYQRINSAKSMGAAYNNLGNIHTNMKEYDKAIGFYRQSLDIRMKLKDNRGISSTLNNMGSSFHLLGKNTKALKSLQDAAYYSQAAHDDYGLVFTYINLAEVYSSLKQTDTSNSYLQKGLAIASREHNKGFLEAIYALYSKNYEISGNISEALRYYKLSTAMNDSIRNSSNLEHISRIQQRFEIRQKEKEIHILQQEKRISTLQRNITLAALILLFLAAGFTFYHFRTRIRKDRLLAEAREKLRQTELENTRLKRDQLQTQVELQSKELTTYTLGFIQKNNILEELKRRIETVANEITDNDSHKVRDLLRLIQLSFNQDKEWEDFKLYFEKVNENFFHTLKNRFPDLSANDLKLCALIRLNLSSKDIATVLGISADSVKMARYRLRKKLGLVTEEGLFNFIISI